MGKYIPKEWEDLGHYYIIKVDGATMKRCKLERDGKREKKHYEAIFPSRNVQLILCTTKLVIV